MIVQEPTKTGEAAAAGALDMLWEIYYHAYDSDTPREDLEADIDHMRAIALQAIELLTES